jgi:tRNA threonylcarbamoyladenosine biosynthesis protein TsaB
MILAINTSTLEYSLALLKEDGTIVSECVVAGGKGHFGGLMPSIDFLFAASKNDIRDIKALAVAAGPGSFTGLRVGIAAAKGLCHGLDIPILSISSLEALASQIFYSDLPVAPILDSRKNEFFTALFKHGNHGRIKRKREDFSIKLEDFPRFFETPTLFIGNHFSSQQAIIKDVLGVKAVIAPAASWNLRAGVVGQLALDRFHASEFDELVGFNPIYLRSPDIRIRPETLLTKTL